MSNKGTQLEKTIRLIQETYKDSENTQIFSNYKIPNESGNNREIDVLIITKINDYEIYIAIECKDYNKKIPVEKIEAFQTKCDRIKQINKKIFVSSKGFQSDAINTAKYYGIELLTAEKLTSEFLKTLIPIRQIKPQILPIVNNVVLTFDADEEKINEMQKFYNGEVFIGKTKEGKKITLVFAEAIEKYKKEIFGLSLIEWMKMENKNNEEITFPVNFGLSFNNYFIKDNQNEYIELLNVTFDVLVKFGFIYPDIISGRSLKDSSGNTKANTINIKIKDELESEMIIKNNDEIDFYLTEKNVTKKLQTLFTYNPKTNKFTKPK